MCTCKWLADKKKLFLFFNHVHVGQPAHSMQIRGTCLLNDDIFPPPKVCMISCSGVMSGFWNLRGIIFTQLFAFIRDVIICRVVEVKCNIATLNVQSVGKAGKIHSIIAGVSDGTALVYHNGVVCWRGHSKVCAVLIIFGSDTLVF